MRLDEYMKSHYAESYVGLRVRICRSYSIDRLSYNGDFIGEYGYIKRDNTGVELDNYENNRSSYNVYWFDKTEIEVIKEDDVEDNKVEAMTGNYKVAFVKFYNENNGKEYCFATYPEDNIQVGDNALVYCSNGYTTGYSVVGVIDIKEKYEVSNKPTNELICKVDFTNCIARKNAREEKRSLKAKMDAMIKENKDMMLYQALAEKSPEMAEILKKFNSIADV